MESGCLSESEPLASAVVRTGACRSSASFSRASDASGVIRPLTSTAGRLAADRASAPSSTLPGSGAVVWEGAGSLGSVSATAARTLCGTSKIGRAGPAEPHRQEGFVNGARDICGGFDLPSPLGDSPDEGELVVDCRSAWPSPDTTIIGEPWE